MGKRDAAERVGAERVDAVVVGAGAAGGVYAARLAAAGKRVVILEAGPRWDLPDMISSQLWARRLKWGGAPVLSEGANPIGHNVNNGSGRGGAALHHYGTWPRMPADVFRMRSLYGRGLDWPFDYEELRPWYDRVQEEVGISGDAQAEVFRPPGKPYPMPPLKTFRHGDLLAAGFRKLDLPVAPLPLIINSVPYRGRAACIYDGWCDAGCPIGALANPLFNYLRDAEESGAELRTGCEVTRVLTDARGWADAVEYVQRVPAAHGKPARTERKILPARTVVLAASYIQNPRILLNSASAQHPQGLGNSRDLIGRHLGAEASVFVYGLFRERTEPYMGVNAGQYTHRNPVSDAKRPEIFGGYQWQIGPASKPNDLFGIAIMRPDLHGARLHAFLRTASQHIAYMVGFAGALPNAGNRVMLSDRTDALGMRLARVEHATDQVALGTARFMLEQGQAAAKAAGAYEVWTGRIGTGHVVGGTLMGSDPSQSLCDGFARTYEVPNLFIGGAGLFPTTGGASPTFTIHAVALRSAEHLVAKWTDYARAA